MWTHLTRRYATPALLFGMLAAWLWLRHLEVGLLVATVSVQVASVSALALLEWMFPHPTLARRKPGTLLSDLLFNGVTFGSAVLLPSLILIPGAHELGTSLGTVPLWPKDWPFWLHALVAVLVIDFTSYWWHRLQHTTGTSWMWRLHSVHHAPPHFDLWMGARVHPLDVTVFACVGYSFVTFLGAPIPAVETAAFFAASVGFIHHTSVATDCGWLNRLIPFADHHVVHHSALERENGNFGNITTLFDQLFGSYLPPTSDPSPIGAWSLRSDYPQTNFGFQLLSPFGRFWQRAKRPVLRADSRPLE